MNRILAAAPVLVVGGFAAAGRIPLAILSYHVLCAAVLYGRRSRLRERLRWDREARRWTLVVTILVVGFLGFAPLVLDPRPFRGLFLRTLFDGVDAPSRFSIFAAYTMIVHAPLEELYWRAIVLDPDRAASGVAGVGNSIFFYLLHAVPLGLLMGARGPVFALPALAGAGLWSFVTIRTRSVWPALVSHWAADAVILGEMWFFFIR